MSLKHEIDSYEIIEGKIEIKSKSGNIYFITKDSCSCKAFGFRKTCRHYVEAKDQGLLNELEKQTSKDLYYEDSHFSSEYIKNMRLDALKAFLTKNNISYSENKIIEIEKKITMNTKVEEVLNWFKS